MNRDQYYQDLDPNELDLSLVVAIEAASYCESSGEKDIRFIRLRERSENFLNEITNVDRRDFGGNFLNILNSCCRGGFLSVKKVGKKETRIRPNIPAVQKKVSAMRTENLDTRNKN